MLPSFEVVARRRPVSLLVPGSHLPAAPYVAVESPVRDTLTLASGAVSVSASFDDRVTLHTTVDGRTTTHRSRRAGRPGEAVESVALTLTGPQVTAFTREAGQWVARARYDLTDEVDVHDESWLRGLETHGGETSGRFGQLGLRDLRLVTAVDGTPYRPDGQVLLTATSAGPGWFPTAHTSVWSLDPDSLELEHRADLFCRRDGGVYGDHAVHLLRQGDRWLLATSTWGDFHPQKRPVRVALAESAADLTRGVHVLDSRTLALPTTGFRSVGVWDPHLVRTDDGWLVGYVSASRWFRFHPVLAAGPEVESLTVAAADTSRRETEGTTLVATEDGWRVLASDRRRKAYPVLDLGLGEIGTLDATYPSNIPWPTLVPLGSEWLLVGFDGSRYGGRLLGYGSHGSVVIQRSVSR